MNGEAQYYQGLIENFEAMEYTAEVESILEDLYWKLEIAQRNERKD